MRLLNRIECNLIPIPQAVGISGNHVIDKGNRHIFGVKNIIIDCPRKRQLQPYLLVLKFRPEDARRIEQLKVLF